jgi:hypothetical protein
MTDTFPTRLSIVSKALGAQHSARAARKAENKDTLDRGEELLKRILGADAEHATLSDDFEGVLFELDEMEFLFLEGATPEDDYFQVALFGLVSPRAVRTLAGVGQALDEIIERIRITVEYIHENLPA